MFDVLIVGGGLVGSTCALALAQELPNYKIGLIDAIEPSFDYASFDNRIYAISPNNMAKLSQLVEGIDISRIGLVEKMLVYGDDNSNITFDCHDANIDYLSQIVEYANLHKALLYKLKQCSNVQLIYTKLADKISNNDIVEVFATNGTVYATKWLIAADGANSFVRNHTTAKTEQTNYFEAGVVANFACENPHNNVAYQWFLVSGILAYLPLPNQHISIVYSTNEYEKVLSMSKPDFCDYISGLAGNKLGALNLINKPVAFPLKLNLVNKFYDNKIIFIGDAAHTIHPLAGQGVNLGFGDVWELVALFKKGDLDAANLNKYAAVRMLDVRSMQLVCHNLNRLFNSQSHIIKFMRNRGLNIFNNLSIFKQYVVHNAIGY